MSRFIRYTDKGGKSILFVVKDDSVLTKHNEIWDSLKRLISKKLRKKHVYDDKYINTKVRSFNGVVRTDVHGKKMSKRRYALRLFGDKKCGF